VGEKGWSGSRGVIRGTTGTIRDYRKGKESRSKVGLIFYSVSGGVKKKSKGGGGVKRPLQQKKKGKLEGKERLH